MAENSPEINLENNNNVFILKSWRLWQEWVRAYAARKLRPHLRYEDINYEMTLREWMDYHQNAIAKVTELVAGRRALVIHDSIHLAANVLHDLRSYAPLVSVGSYLIVEDGNVDTLKVETAFRPLLGPLYAIEQFLAEAPYFQIDRACERYFITQNPSGFLKRIA